MNIVYKLDTGRVIEIGKGDHSRFGKDEYGDITLSVYPDGWDAESMSLNDLKVVDGALVLRTKEDWSDEERVRALNMIDRDTGSAITAAIHPLVGTDESIGTIRDMVVRIINAIGLAPTADFARLNDIAIAAIKDGAKKKAALK